MGVRSQHSPAHLQSNPIHTQYNTQPTTIHPQYNPEFVPLQQHPNTTHQEYVPVQPHNNPSHQEFVPIQKHSNTNQPCCQGYNMVPMSSFGSSQTPNKLGVKPGDCISETCSFMGRETPM